MNANNGCELTLAERVESAIWSRQGRKRGAEILFTAPCHNDQHPSARWNPEKQTWFCDVCALGGGTKDLAERFGFNVDGNGRGRPRDDIVALYDYRDESGELLFQVVRKIPKNFSQRRPEGKGGWVWKLDGVRRVLYRLPELLAADSSRDVFLVEGEKDVDRLQALGFVATCNVGGAGKWRAEYAEILRGRPVAILPDNDQPGRTHANTVAESLLGLAGSVRILELPNLPEKGDVSDWLDAGGTPEQLREMVKSTPLWGEPVQRQQIRGAPAIGSAVTVRLSEVQPERVRWLWPSRIPIGKLALIDGDPGLGKSNLTLDLAARVTTGRLMPDGAHSDVDTPFGVVLLGAEDGLADTIRPRLEAANADLTRVIALRGIYHENGERPPTIADIDAIRDAVAAVDARLVVVDPLMAHLPDDASAHRDQEMRRVLTPLATLAEELGVAIVVIRHLNKSGSGVALYRGGGSIGIIGAVRSSLVVARDPEDESGRRRVLASVKCNLAALPPALAYRLETASNGAACVKWDGEATFTADELLAAVETVGQRDERKAAEQLLIDALNGGERLAEDVTHEARQEGFTEKQIRTARERLKVVVRREGFGKGGRWFWSLPNAIDAHIDAIDAPIPEAGNKGVNGHLWSAAYRNGNAAAEYVDVRFTSVDAEGF